MPEKPQSPFSSMFQQAMNEPENILGEEIERIQELQESGRYILERKLEGGGMKLVSVQDDSISDRQIVMAELREDRRDPNSIQAFLREARITARLEHPNIVPVHEIGINDEDLPYYTMKYIDGKNLGLILHQLLKEDNRLEIKQSDLLSIFEKVCQAVAFAHSKNIIHLDLKPENILVSEFGQVQVCDWGLARDLNEEIDEGGMITGTPGFISPEQILQRNIGKASDIYALGALLYAILTYEPPLAGFAVDETISKTVQGQIPSPVNLKGSYGIPRPLNAICSKAMELSSLDRYQKVEDLLTDIDAYKHVHPTVAQDPGVIIQGWLFIKRNLATSVVTFMMIAILAFITNSYLNRLKEAKIKHQLTAAKTAPHYFNEAVKDYDKQQFEHALRKIKVATKYTSSPDYLELKSKLFMTLRRFDEARVHFNNMEVVDKRMIELLDLFQYREDRYSDEFLFEYIKELNRQHLPGIVNNVMYIRNSKITDLEAEMPFIHKAMQAINRADSYTIEVVNNKIHFRGNSDLNRIEPLAGLPIEELRIPNTSIRRLTPLKGTKVLKYLDVRNTMIGSLNDLAGHDLEYMDISGTLISSFIPLDKLQVKHIRMRGLKVLRLSAILTQPKIASVELDVHRFSTKYDKHNIKKMKEKGILIEGKTPKRSD